MKSNRRYEGIKYLRNDYFRLVLIDDMALSRLSVKCVLCRGAISIRAGNLDKMRLHMENDHDVFYNQDLLISLNFLEDFEREEIILVVILLLSLQYLEKVL